SMGPNPRRTQTLHRDAASLPGRSGSRSTGRPAISGQTVAFRRKSSIPSHHSHQARKERIEGNLEVRVALQSVEHLLKGADSLVCHTIRHLRGTMTNFRCDSIESEKGILHPRSRAAYISKKHLQRLQDKSMIFVLCNHLREIDHGSEVSFCKHGIDSKEGI